MIWELNNVLAEVIWMFFVIIRLESGNSPLNSFSSSYNFDYNFLIFPFLSFTFFSSSSHFNLYFNASIFAVVSLFYKLNLFSCSLWVDCSLFLSFYFNFEYDSLYINDLSSPFYSMLFKLTMDLSVYAPKFLLYTLPTLYTIVFSWL